MKGRKKRRDRVIPALNSESGFVWAACNEAQRIVFHRWAEIEILASRLLAEFELSEDEIYGVVARVARERIGAKIKYLGEKS